MLIQASVRRRPRPPLFQPPLVAFHAPPLVARLTATASRPTSPITVRLPTPLGLSLTQTHHQIPKIIVSYLHHDSPAVGLVRPGDIITHISGSPTRSLTSLAAHIHASQHPVTLTLERPAAEKPAIPDDLFSHQDDALANLIASYLHSRPQATADALTDLLSAAVGIVKSRAFQSPRSPNLISSVLYRLKRANVPLDHRFYNATLSAFVQAGSPMRAVELFADIQRPNVECFTTLIKAYSVLKRPDDAMRLVPMMRKSGVTPNIRTYNALISSCVRGGKLEKARHLFSEMLTDEIRPNAVSWNIIINWHVQQRKGPDRLQGALSAFADMKASGVAPNVITFTTLMKAYAKSGLMNKAEEVFVEMKQRLPAYVDAPVYNTLLNAYAARLEWRRCLELLHEMENYTCASSSFNEMPSFGMGVVPTHSRSFSQRRPWLDSGTGDKQEDRGHRLLSGDINEDSGCRPDSVSYALVVKACASAGRPKLARELFDTMMGKGFFPPPPRAVVSLIGGYANAGMLTECFEVLKNLKSWSVYVDVRMLTSLMHACLTAGQAKLALSVYAKLKSAKLDGDVVTYTLVLRAYGTMGELDKAFNMLKGMHNKGGNARPNVVTYNTLMECSLMHGDTDLALRALHMLLEDKNKTARINRQTFIALTEGCSTLNAEKRLEFLMDVLRSVREKEAAPNGCLYGALLEGCEECGEWDLGSSLVEERENGRFLVGRKDERSVRMLEDGFRSREMRK